MRTLRIDLRATVASRSETAGLLRQPGDAVIVERVVPRLLLLACPDGCGDELAVNLDSRVGPAWRLYRRDSGLTIYPSVWRDTGCGSHFIIWKDEIYLFNAVEDEAEDRDRERLWSANVGLERGAVLGALDAHTLTSYVDVADRLDALPWEVLIVCRRLVRERAAREGKGDQRGSFVRTR